MGLGSDEFTPIPSVAQLSAPDTIPLSARGNQKGPESKAESKGRLESKRPPALPHQKVQLVPAERVFGQGLHRAIRN